MTEEAQATEPTTTPASTVISQVVSEPRLYAGKYKSVEELEKAYGHSVNAFVEKGKIEKELERYKVPEDYSVPDGHNFRDEDVQEIKDISRIAQLSQEQFERTFKEMHTKVVTNAEQHQKELEERKAAIGDEKLNLLEEYVEKHYPGSVREIVFNKLIRDESAMTDALKDREQKLNTQIPGMSGAKGVSVESYDGQKELTKAAMEYNSKPHDREAKERYLKLSQEVGHARFDKR